MTSSDIDSATFRHVLGHYPTGVCVVTALEEDQTPIGMVVGSFTSVSLDPPLIAFFPDQKSTSWPRIEKARQFCVNVLAGDQHLLCRQFATAGSEKFTGVAHRASNNGAPILEDAVAWIDCSLAGVHEFGDHYMALGRVDNLGVGRSCSPLLFFQGGFGQFSLHS